MKDVEVQLLHQALHVLRGYGDGAAAHDGQGFAQPDVVLGHYLAALATEMWEPWMQGAAWELAWRYPGQLLTAGIDISTIARPEAELDAWEQARQEGAHHVHRLHAARHDLPPR